MTRIFCFKHPEYRPTEKPPLHCSNCCKMYVNKIREINESKQPDPIAWIDDQIRVLEKRYQRG